LEMRECRGIAFIYGLPFDLQRGGRTGIEMKIM